MNVSIVVCTYNNCNRLSITLDRICSVAIPSGIQWELVIVNNNSSDDTEEVIHTYTDSLPIQYRYEPKQGKSCALNTALRTIRGELVIFCDDDVEPAKQWLTAYWKAYQAKGESHYFGGPVLSKFEYDTPSNDLLSVAPSSVSGLDYGTDPIEIGSDEIFLGANWACASVHLDKAGFFNESIGLNATRSHDVGEETDMMEKLEGLGLRGWYVPEASIYHFVPKEKCTLEYVGARRAVSAVRHSKGGEEPSLWFGLPVGLYFALIFSYVMYIYTLILGGKWRSYYIQWRTWRERIDRVSE